MAPQVFRVRAAQRFVRWPRRSVLLSILITLAAITAVLSLPGRGASAPPYTENG